MSTVREPAPTGTNARATRPHEPHVGARSEHLRVPRARGEGSPPPTVRRSAGTGALGAPHEPLPTTAPVEPRRRRRVRSAERPCPRAPTYRPGDSPTQRAPEGARVHAAVTRLGVTAGSATGELGW